MPYIPEDQRQVLDVGAAGPKDAGELNYLLTELVEVYRALHGDSYATFSNITAALDDAKDEFRRRVVHPYEDRKRAENGDVYAPLEDQHGNV